MGISPSQTKQSEAELLDQLPIAGRKMLLRQFIKALHLCQTGQGKGIFLSGNEGVGKTTLLRTFLDLTETHYQCCAVTVDFPKHASPEEFFAHIVEAILNKAYRILDNTLEKANACTEYFGLHWNHQDLIRTVALVHMQESMQGRKQVNVDALTQSIFGAVPFFKRLDANLKPKIHELARVLSDPWVTMAVSLVNPINTQVQHAVELVKTIRGSERPFETKGYLSTPTSPISLIGQQQVNKALPGGKEPQEPEKKVEGPRYQDDETDKPPAPVAPEDMEAAAEMLFVEEPEPEAPNGVSLKQIQDSLVDLIQFINNGLNGLNNAFILTFDHWEYIQETTSAHREAIKDFLSEVLRKTIEQRNYRIMFIVSCQSEAESYAMSEPLYNGLRTKYLVPALADKVQQQLLQDQLTLLQLQCDDQVLETVINLCKGNPAWLHLLLKVIETDRVTMDRRNLEIAAWHERFSVTDTTDLLEILFTRMQLPFIGQEAQLETILKKLVHGGLKEPFTYQDCIRAMAMTPDVHPLVQTVLHSMAQFGFIEPVDMPKGEVGYRFYKPFMLSYMRRKLRPLQEEVPTEDKLSSLMRVLPLTVQAGELTRDKTNELLAMARAMEKPDLIEFMEDTLIETLCQNNLSQTHLMTLLESLALMKTERSIQALLNQLEHPHEAIREFACLQLMELVRKKPLPVSTRLLVDQVMPLVDDPAAKVQQQAFQFLALCPEHRKEIEPVFLDGLRSSDSTIQLLSINGLQQLGNRTKEVLHALTGIINKSNNPLLGKAALMSIRHFPPRDITPVLSGILQNTLDHPLWKDAFMMMMQMDLGQALPWIRKTLENTSDPELRMFLLKRLGSSHSATAETILRDVLNESNGKSLLPEERWLAIRSLGWIGNQMETLNVLEHQAALCQDDAILNHSLTIAIKQVRQRVVTTPEEVAQSIFPTPVSSRVTTEEDVITPEVIDDTMSGWRMLAASAQNNPSHNN